MGKRKHSKSKGSEYESILRRVKELEHQLKKRRRSSSTSSEASGGVIPDYDQDLQGRDDYVSLDEVIGTDDEETRSPELPTPIVPTATEPGPSTEPPPAHKEANPLTVPNEVALPSLDPEILQLLGDDPSNQKDFGENLHKDIASRWSHILTHGLPKDTLLDLGKRYLPAENCPNMRAPKLNLEIKAALSEINVKKDIYSLSKQNQLASGLTAIGQVLNWALSSNSTVPQEIIKSLSDAGRLICDSHYKESQSRRYAALNTLNRSIRDTVKNTKIDENLFGSGLSEHIKSSKAISKTGSDMKSVIRIPYKPPATNNQPQRGALNLRGVPPPRAAAAVEPRTYPAPRRPPRDRRQDAPRGRRTTGYTRQPPPLRRH